MAIINGIKINEMVNFNIGGINVYSLDKYHAKTKPDRILADETPVWDGKSFTKIGNMIESYKIQKNAKILSDLVDLFMQSSINKKNEFDAVVPVPSTSNTLHISEVAKKIAQRLEIEYCDCLVKNTDIEMKYLNDSERKEQQNFISCSDTIRKYSSIILIDDIIKTGKTMTDCVSKIHEKNSKCSIIGFAFCRGMNT